MLELVDFLGRKIATTEPVYKISDEQTLDTDLVVPSGQTKELFAGTVDIDPDAQLILDLSIPALEITSTNGGEVTFEIHLDPGAITMTTGTITIGRINSDRALMWPVRVSHHFDQATPGGYQVNVHSLSGGVTCHAGPGYGNTRLTLSAK